MKKTGGPAFPLFAATGYTGMTLRDYFATMAMQPMFEVWEDFEDWGFEELAMRSYEMADAMLKAREK